MNHLEKPKLPIRDIINDCADSYKDTTCDGIKQRLKDSRDFIIQKSKEYDRDMGGQKRKCFDSHKKVNDMLSTDEMRKIYKEKFVGVKRINERYYNKILSIPHYRRCPICNRIPVSELDHYLPVTKYPVYAITPYNLVPVCSECNKKSLISISMPRLRCCILIMMI